jgi:hypothetical protein
MAILFEIHFCSRGLEGFRFLQIYPYFADWSSEKLESLQCGPPVPAGGGLAKIRRSPAAGRPGTGVGRCWGC